MTSPQTVDYASISPFQRSALAYESRPIVVKIEVPIPPERLVGQGEAAVRTSSSFMAELRHSPTWRIPRQARGRIRREHLPGEGFKLVSGHLSLCAMPSGAGSALTIAGDALFVDAPAIELLCRRIAEACDIADPVDFLAVAAEHEAMLREGELDQETAYWQAFQRIGDSRPALGANAGKGGGPVSVSVPLCPLSLAEMAAAKGIAPEEMLYLSLRLLIDRLDPDLGSIGRLIDARALMGLEGAPGPFTQIVPDIAPIDPEASADTLLEQQVARLQRHMEMAGGSALFETSNPPTIVFDPRTTWLLPAGWRLLDAFEARSGAVLLRGSLEPAGPCLVASACDGADAEALRAVLAGWAEVLEAIVRRPGSPWRSIHIGRAEEIPVLREPVGADAAEDLCARVAELAAADPEAVAVRHGHRQMTRRELTNRIGAVAEAIGPLESGTVVAVLADPEPDLLAAWLAVLWQGGAFLPLLPAEPPRRIEKALEASGASILLLGKGAPAILVPPSCRLIGLGDVATGQAGAGPRRAVDTGEVAYQLRTSGSSGSPKHVAVTRGSLNNYLRWIAREWLAGDEGRLPVVSSPIFDASFKQLLGPQYAGRPTWLLGGDASDPVQAYAELASEEAPFCLNCTPTYWAELLRVGRELPVRLRLRRLLLGGETVGDALLRQTVADYPDTEIWNLYGPTEATATATAGRLAPGEPVHVGEPVAGALVVIADRYGRRLPQGLQGEVWIAGPGIAKGYVGGFDEMAFAPLRAGRESVPAYRTGDIGRIDPRGRLNLAGRRDSQLKLRGWRIEPGEIEGVAEALPDVSGARIVLDSSAGSERLRLFYVGDAGETEVAEALRARLPSAMLPATITRVPNFPRSATGKLDESALIAMASARTTVEPDDYDPLQHEVASVWSDLVGQGLPSLDADFFTAGGHSLLLARLVNQLRARGHRGLSLRQVVRNPTVRSIAAAARSPAETQAQGEGRA